MSRQPRDVCGQAAVDRKKPCDERLLLVNGALVCPSCDSIHLWPSVQRKEAEYD